jgi:hypothetical protein
MKVEGNSLVWTTKRKEETREGDEVVNRIKVNYVYV